MSETRTAVGQTARDAATPHGLDQMLTLDQVADLLNVGKRTLEGRRASGAFPPPDLKLGTRVLRWWPATIEAWVASGSQTRPDRSSPSHPRVRHASRRNAS